MSGRKGLQFPFLLLLVARLTAVAYGLPVTGTLAGWEPSAVTFEYTYDGLTLSGQIDYAVYDNYPGYAPSGGQYVYAYQIINFDVSTVSVDFFSVGILEGADVGDIDSDDYQVVDGIEPFLEYFSPSPEAPQSAVYLFLPHINGLVGSGQHSFNLLFSSDNEPIYGFGTVAGGSIGGLVEGLPTPIPEPVSVLLLALGAVIVRRKR